MLELVEGKGLGSGKSAFVIERLLALWLVGGTAYVSASFHVIWEECKLYAERYHGLILEDDQFNEVPSDKVTRIHEFTAPGTEDNPVLIVIDEAQDQFDVRDHADKNKNDIFKWACQSRHDDNDLIFVTQNVKNVDARIRRIATYIWSVRNSRFHSTPGIGNTAKVIQLLTLGMNNGWYFIRTQLDYDGRTVMQKVWRKADMRYLRCYRSKAMAGKRTRGGERIAKKTLAKVSTTRSPKMVRWIFLVGMVAVIASVVTMCKSGGPMGGIGSTIKTQPATAPAAPPTQPGTLPAQKPVSGSSTPEIKVEDWTGTGQGWLRTKDGEYIPRTMSAHGLVEAVESKSARIRKPDGGVLYIVGKDWAVPPSPPRPTATEKPREIVIAPTAAPVSIVSPK
jgi:hypothetical protein